MLDIVHLSYFRPECEYPEMGHQFMVPSYHSVISEAPCSYL